MMTRSKTNQANSSSQANDDQDSQETKSAVSTSKKSTKSKTKDAGSTKTKSKTKRKSKTSDSKSKKKSAKSKSKSKTSKSKSKNKNKNEDEDEDIDILANSDDNNDANAMNDLNNALNQSGNVAVRPPVINLRAASYWNHNNTIVAEKKLDKSNEEYILSRYVQLVERIGLGELQRKCHLLLPYGHGQSFNSKNYVAAFVDLFCALCQVINKISKMSSNDYAIQPYFVEYMMDLILDTIELRINSVMFKIIVNETVFIAFHAW